MSFSPFEVPLIRDLILEYVGHKYVKKLREVNQDWNKKAVALLNGSDTWTIHVSTLNLNMLELFSESPSPPSSSSSLSWSGGGRLKSLFIDFGPQPTHTEFHQIIDAVSSHITGAGVGGVCVKVLKCDQLPPQNTPEDFLALIKFLHLIGPGLAQLSLPSCSRHTSDLGRLEEDIIRLLPLPHPADLIRFPKLKRLVHTWNLVDNILYGILEPSIVPQLSRLRLKCQEERSGLETLDDDMTILFCHKLRLLSHLNELSLDVTDLLLFNRPENLPTVPNVGKLTLHVFRWPTDRGVGRYLPLTTGQKDTRVACRGAFIGSVFPNLTDLRLKYDARRAHSDRFEIPWAMERMESLRSLTYCLKSQARDPVTGNREALQLGHLKLLSHVDNGFQTHFPQLQDVSTDFGFELTSTEGYLKREIENQPIFCTVTKLLLSTGILRPYLNKKCREVAVKLHHLYPNVTQLVLDTVEKSPEPTAITSTRAVVVARTIIEEFNGQDQKLELLELLNYSPHCVAELLLSAKGSEGAIALQGLRHLNLKLSLDMAKTSDTTVCPHIPPTTGVTLALSLTSLVARYPHLEEVQVNEEILAQASGCSVADIYIEAFDLQRVQTNLKIQFSPN